MIYVAGQNTDSTIENYSCYELAEQLIINLRMSNGLEFMPPEQRMALIAELSQPVDFQE